MFAAFSFASVHQSPPCPTRCVPGPTGVCEGLDVVGQVDVHTLCILHFLEDDPNEPHGHKIIPVAETHHIQNAKEQTNNKLLQLLRTSPGGRAAFIQRV